MPSEIKTFEAHLPGERAATTSALVQPRADGPLPVDTLGQRIHVEWDPQAPVTPMGQLVFFSQFLALSGLFTNWVAQCPVVFTSPNAPTLTNLLGTVLLSALAGHQRYAHITALRADPVNPPALGMTKVCCEDSVRRAFADVDPAAGARWQTQALQATWLPALRHAWILDLDVTVKTLFGHQEGAAKGYNPNKPGRPSHAYHNLWVRHLRRLLDVEVRPGNETAATHSRTNLWRVVDALPAECRPWLLCGDSSHGQEGLVGECEARGQHYVFRLRLTKGVKQLVRQLEKQGGWSPTVNGWAGISGSVRRQGWSRARRVIVQRREQAGAPATAEAAQPLLWRNSDWCASDARYAYQVLVTDLAHEVLTVADLYRQRAGSENPHDELKNQWGWGGYTTGDLWRCQVAARNVALVYNWWVLFVRCAEPERAREAITSRPLLLSAVGRVVESGRQKTLRLTSMHGQATVAQTLLTQLSRFLSGLGQTAEQLSSAACWERIWARILEPFLRPVAVLPAASA